MVVMVVIQIITTHYYVILPIKHFKRKPELPLIAVDRVFRVSITAYYWLLLHITAYYFHYFHYFHYFLKHSQVMGSNRSVMGCIFGMKMSIIPSYFMFFHIELCLCTCLDNRHPDLEPSSKVGAINVS
jgi:hypothetical protein